jgi:uncharacterized protein YhbP (UPF0306 family)
MNLRAYYQKIREAEALIADEVVHVVSLPTDDGGLAGIITEVSRAIAARLLVDLKSRLATEEEKNAHLERQHAARKKMQEEYSAQRLQVAIVSDLELSNLRRGKKG